jgi:hypothetical protein
MSAEWDGNRRYSDGVQWTQRRVSAVGQQRAVQGKSGAVAALLTVLWPGAGHMYLGLTSKGMP